MPQAAELVDSAEGEGYAYTATALPKYNGVTWTRHTLWQPGKYTFALDELTAEEAGDYSFVLGWRSLGEPTLAPGTFESAQDETRQPGVFADSGELVESVTETSGEFLYHMGGYNALLFRADGEGDFVGQSMSSTLKPSESACFQNVFSAWTGEAARQLELRRVSEHCALVKCGDDLALVGAASAGTLVEVGPLRAEGKLFHVGTSGVILHDATAVLAGKALAAGYARDRSNLAEVLQTAWREAEAPTGRRTPTLQDAPKLSPRWTADLPGQPLSVASLKAGDGARIAVGTADGEVLLFGSAGKPAGTFAANGPVHALHACDLDGDGADELLVGSDDEHVYALDANLKLRWKYRVQFLRDEQPWLWWTLGSSKVRAIHTDDLTGEGKPEVLLGVGNMRFHCLDATGKERWRFRTDHGIPTTIATADLFGDGKRRVLIGNGLTSSNGSCWVLDGRGNQLQKYYNGSWCTSLPAIAVGDLDGDGKNTVFCGNNRGDVRAYPATTEKAEQLWLRNMTRPVRSLTVLPTKTGAVVAVGSDSGYVCAFNQTGAKVWGVALSSAITHTALATAPRSDALLIAGCKDGNVFVVNGEGRLVRHASFGARLEAMVVADVDGDGRDEIAVVTSEVNRLHMLRIR